MKTRKQAALEIFHIYNAMEVRKVSLKTVYNRIYRNGNVWRLNGYGYDYTA